MSLNSSNVRTFAEIYKHNDNFHIQNILSSSLLLSALVIPNIVTSIPSHDIASVDLIANIKVVIVTWSVLSMLYVHGHSIWNCKSAITYPFLVLLQCCSSRYHRDHQFHL